MFKKPRFHLNKNLNQSCQQGVVTTAIPKFMQRRSHAIAVKDH